MRANVNHGKLIAPKSLGAGLRRRKLLVFEVKRIEAQLHTSTTERPDRDELWRRNAERALKLFQLEQRLLDEWIEVRQNDSERLLREAYETLQVLEVEVDFTPSETELMERLEGFFEKEKDDGKEAATGQEGHGDHQAAQERGDDR